MNGEKKDLVDQMMEEKLLGIILPRKTPASMLRLLIGTLYAPYYSDEMLDLMRVRETSFEIPSLNVFQFSRAIKNGNLLLAVSLIPQHFNSNIVNDEKKPVDYTLKCKL
jgi:hypothetical protein